MEFRCVFRVLADPYAESLDADAGRVYAGVAWGERYDLVSDPHEMINRWSGPAYASVRGDPMLEITQPILAVSETSPHPIIRA